MFRLGWMLLLIGVTTAGYAQPIHLNQRPPRDALLLNGAVDADAPEEGYRMRFLGDFSGGSGISELAIYLPFAEDGSFFQDHVTLLFGEFIQSLPQVVVTQPLPALPLRMQGPSGSGFGHNVMPGGDLNRDGFADIAVGAPFYEDDGRIYFIQGSPDFPTLLSVEHPDQPDRILFTISGHEGNQVGFSLGRPGDLDDNGFSEAIVPAPQHAFDQDGQPIFGGVYVVYSAPELYGRNLNTPTLFPTHTLTITDTPVPDDESGVLWEFFGETAGSLGDLDGDEIDDLVVFRGISNEEPPRARIHVLSSQDRVLGRFNIDTVPMEQLILEFDLFPEVFMYRQTSLAAADFDDDGRNELLVGFPNGQLAEQSQAGGVAVLIQVDEMDAAASPISITADGENGAIFFTHSQADASLGVDVVMAEEQLALLAPGVSSPQQPENRAGAVYGFEAASLPNQSGVVEVEKQADHIIYGAPELNLGLGNLDFFIDRNDDDRLDIALSASGSEMVPGRIGWLVSPRPVLGDVTGDGVRDRQDVFLFSQQWQRAEESTSDLDGDGQSNPIDLMNLLLGQNNF